MFLVIYIGNILMKIDIRFTIELKLKIKLIQKILEREI